MTPVEQQRLSMKAEIFKAMGQPTRLRILELLLVGEIAARIGRGSSSVSKHLSLLRKQGLIADRKDGSKVFYRGTVPHLGSFMQCVEKYLHRKLDSKMSLNMDSS